MQSTLNKLNSLPFFWALLSVPAVILLYRYGIGEMIAMDLLHPTGELSARLMIIAMAVTPLIKIFGHSRWTGWLLRRRRSFGVAAFGYAVLHLVFYIVDMEEVQAMLAEIGAPGIWTGWLAMLLFVPLAVTSNNMSMRWLKGRWKLLQRLVYAAALLTLAHWLLIHDGVGTALAHFIPLAALQLLRGIIIYTRQRNESVQPEFET